MKDIEIKGIGGLQNKTPNKLNADDAEPQSSKQIRKVRNKHAVNAHPRASQKEHRSSTTSVVTHKFFDGLAGP